ncbi:putative rhamnosyl transferase [Sulfitobacter sp. HNIBRBA3233]|uniref:putative rhamnosyl transferase n=1 Tax=Sulfitobacter marinivivus TaxID=3158558 RepID=UPI0032DF09B7
MRCIGLCRFSYAGKGGFKNGDDDLDALKAFLYRPDRLEERFRLFEAVTLPSIRAQTDPDFTFLIVTGKSLPAPALTRLRALTADIPQCEIRQVPPRPHRRVMRKVINEWRGPPEAPCLQFRLDDDDAMGVSFVERLRQSADDLRALTARHTSVAVDFNQGYVFRAGPQGLRVAPYHYPYSAIALGMIVQAGSDDTIMNHGHENLWTTMPTVTFTGDDMMLRGHNDFNDSRLKGKNRAFDYRPLDAAQAAHIKTTFGVDDAQVRAVFSAP